MAHQWYCENHPRKFTVEGLGEGGIHYLLLINIERLYRIQNGFFLGNISPRSAPSTVVPIHKKDYGMWYIMHMIYILLFLLWWGIGQSRPGKYGLMMYMNPEDQIIYTYSGRHSKIVCISYRISSVLWILRTMTYYQTALASQNSQPTIE